MADLRSRIEVAKLASELGTTTERLAFLAEHDVEDIRALHTTISTVLHERNEDRITRLAGLAPLLPTAITARIAEHAMGPLVSARFAGAISPDDAAKLAKKLRPAFLSEVAACLDPQRAKTLLSRLPDSLLIDAGRGLREKHEHVSLGRFVAVVNTEVALGVMDGSSGDELLQVGLFTEAADALAAIIDRLPDDRLVEVLQAARARDIYEDAVALLLPSVADERRKRLTDRITAEAETS
ncbi:hypothetical protein [Nocardioides piscis]|uniref:Uncharacterized protein n=1 Tax=Nocardioides piscis TaxID=2714938 RepID=A0A6G7YI78_9ACTN|nr:hypothetical protein [Nocardioides piscis]QIK76341.1 hypothetical protein G7071_13865 [Nocardioides piscis]